MLRHRATQQCSLRASESFFGIIPFEFGEGFFRHPDFAPAFRDFDDVSPLSVSELVSRKSASCPWKGLSWCTPPKTVCHPHKCNESTEIEIQSATPTQNCVGLADVQMIAYSSTRKTVVAMNSTKLIRILRFLMTLCCDFVRIDRQVIFLYASKPATNWLMPHRLRDFASCIFFYYKVLQIILRRSNTIWIIATRAFGHQFCLQNLQNDGKQPVNQWPRQ